MSGDERLDRVARRTQEVVTREELRDLLERVEHPRCYVGYEPSGFLHIGGGVVLAEKLKDLIEAGFHTTLLLADWHAYINDKFDGSLDAIRTCGEYVRDGFRALGVPDSLEFRFASDLVREPDYWMDVLRVSKSATVARVRRALPILGRGDADADRDASKLIYPAMQVADIHALDLDLALGGMDQRHAHMLYRDLAPRLGWKAVVAVHTPLLGGLQGGGRMDAPEGKMSKSRPESAILIHDSPKAIRGKLEGAFCPPRDTEGNPVVDIAKLVVLPLRGHLDVRRSKAHGGDVRYDRIDSLVSAYSTGELHPQDLKVAVSDALAEALAPVRLYFERHPERLDALRSLVRG